MRLSVHSKCSKGSSINLLKPPSSWSLLEGNKFRKGNSPTLSSSPTFRYQSPSEFLPAPQAWWLLLAPSSRWKLFESCFWKADFPAPTCLLGRTWILCYKLFVALSKFKQESLIWKWVLEKFVLHLFEKYESMLSLLPLLYNYSQWVRVRPLEQHLWGLDTTL